MIDKFEYYKEIFETLQNYSNLILTYLINTFKTKVSIILNINNKYQQSNYITREMNNMGKSEFLEFLEKIPEDSIFIEDILHIKIGEIQDILIESGKINKNSFFTYYKKAYNLLDNEFEVLKQEIINDNGKINVEKFRKLSYYNLKLFFKINKTNNNLGNIENDYPLLENSLLNNYKDIINFYDFKNKNIYEEYEKLYNFTKSNIFFSLNNKKTIKSIYLKYGLSNLGKSLIKNIEKIPKDINLLRIFNIIDKNFNNLEKNRLDYNIINFLINKRINLDFEEKVKVIKNYLKNYRNFDSSIEKYHNLFQVRKIGRNNIEIYQREKYVEYIENKFYNIKTKEKLDINNEFTELKRSILEYKGVSQNIKNKFLIFIDNYLDRKNFKLSKLNFIKNIEEEIKRKDLESFFYLLGDYNNLDEELLKLLIKENIDFNIIKNFTGFINLNNYSKREIIELYSKIYFLYESGKNLEYFKRYYIQEGLEFLSKLTDKKKIIDIIYGLEILSNKNYKVLKEKVGFKNLSLDKIENLLFNIGLDINFSLLIDNFPKIDILEEEIYELQDISNNLDIFFNYFGDLNEESKKFIKNHIQGSKKILEEFIRFLEINKYYLFDEFDNKRINDEFFKKLNNKVLIKYFLKYKQKSLIKYTREIKKIDNFKLNTSIFSNKNINYNIKNRGTIDNFIYISENIDKNNVDLLKVYFTIYFNKEELSKKIDLGKYSIENINNIESKQLKNLEKKFKEYKNLKKYFSFLRKVKNGYSKDVIQKLFDEEYKIFIDKIDKEVLKKIINDFGKNGLDKEYVEKRINFLSEEGLKKYYKLLNDEDFYWKKNIHKAKELFQEYFLGNVYSGLNNEKIFNYYPYNKKSNLKWLKKIKIDKEKWLSKNKKIFKISKKDLFNSNIENKLINFINVAKQNIFKLGLDKEIISFENYREILNNFEDIYSKVDLKGLSDEKKKYYDDLKGEIKKIKETLNSINKGNEDIEEILIERELNPLKILRMGDVVNGSCLAFDSPIGNFPSVFTNAIDVNRGVFFIRNNKNNQILGRFLVNITDNKKILVFPIYYANTGIDLKKFVDMYIEELSNKLELKRSHSNNDLKNVSLLSGGEVYEDPVI